jgi:hypothetical protein
MFFSGKIPLCIFRQLIALPRGFFIFPKIPLTGAKNGVLLVQLVVKKKEGGIKWNLIEV